MFRPGSRLPALVVAIMVVVLGLVAPLATRAAPRTGAVAAAPTVAATGGERPSEGGTPGGEHAEHARRASPPAGAGAIVRSAAERLRSPVRPLVPVAVLVVAALGSLASAVCGAVPAGRRGMHRRSFSPVRRRGPPALVLA
jgi:hypothetical protein